MNDERQRDEAMDRRLDWALGESEGGAVPPDVSKLVLARLAAGDVVDLDEAPSRRHRWLAAAVMLFGIGVVVAVAVMQRGGKVEPVAPLQQPVTPQGATPEQPLEVRTPEDIRAHPTAKHVRLLDASAKVMAAVPLLVDCETLDVDRYLQDLFHHTSRLVPLVGPEQRAAMLDDDGLSAISKLTKLRVLRIAGNERIQGEGLRHLAQLPLLADLDLRQLRIEDAALTFLPTLASLRRLRLDENLGLTAASLESITQCKSLRRLSLERCPQLNGADLAKLGRMTWLEELELTGVTGTQLLTTMDDSDARWKALCDRAAEATFLDGGCVDDRALAGLQPLTQVRRLALRQGTFTSEGLAALLSKLTQLESLDLTGCAFFASADVASLPTGLRELVLRDGAKVDDATVAATLARCPRLQKLDVAGCRMVSPPVLEQLRQKQLPKDVQPRPIADTATWVTVNSRAALEAATRNNWADAAWIEGVHLDDTCLPVLRQLKRLEGLRLVVRRFHSEDPPPRAISGDAIQFLGELTNLRVLHLEHQELLSNQSLNFLAKLTQLTELRLSGFDTMDGVFVAIEKLPRLQRLELDANFGFSRRALEIVSKLPQLRALSLRGCSQVDATMLEPIGAMTELEELRLGRIPEMRSNLVPGTTQPGYPNRQERLTDAALACLRNKPKLRRLDLEYAHRLTDDGLRVLAGLPALEDLCLASTDGLTAAVLRQLPPGMRRLDLSSCRWVDAAAMALLPTGLHELVIAENQGVDNQALAQLAVRCPQLRRLDVRGCAQVTSQGLGSLPRALEVRADVTNELFPREVRSIDDIATGRNTATETSNVRLLTTSPAVMLWLPKLLDCTHLEVTPDLPPRREDGSLPPPSATELAAMLDDSGMDAIRQLPKLVDLRITRQLRLTDSGFHRLREAPELTWLGLRAQPVPDDVLAEIAQWPHLNGLLLTECAGFTKTGLEALGKGRHMHAFSLFGCTQVRADDLTALLGWSKLDCLHLSTIRDGRASAEEQATEAFLADGWLDDRMLAVVQQLPRLRQLLLWGGSFTSAGLAATLDRLPDLISLDLSACSSFDATAVGLLPRGLQSLNLAHSQTLDDDMLAAIAARCRDLRSVIVFRCPKVTEAGLRHLRALPQAPSVLVPTTPR